MPVSIVSRPDVAHALGVPRSQSCERMVGRTSWSARVLLDPLFCRRIKHAPTTAKQAPELLKAPGVQKFPVPARIDGAFPENVVSKLMVGRSHTDPVVAFHISTQ